MANPGTGASRKKGKKHRKHNRGGRNSVRSRYWNSRRLEKRKVRNLVRCCGMDPIIALVHWREIRVTRIKK